MKKNLLFVEALYFILFMFFSKEKIFIALAIIFFSVLFVIHKILIENQNIINSLKESVKEEIKQNINFYI